MIWLVCWFSSVLEMGENPDGLTCVDFGQCWKWGKICDGLTGVLILVSVGNGENPRWFVLILVSARNWENPRWSDSCVDFRRCWKWGKSAMAWLALTLVSAGNWENPRWSELCVDFRQCWKWGKSAMGWLVYSVSSGKGWVGGWKKSAMVCCGSVAERNPRWFVLFVLFR